jgi:hypothetical protein
VLNVYIVYVVLIDDADLMRTDLSLRQAAARRVEVNRNFASGAANDIAGRTDVLTAQRLNGVSGSVGITAYVVPIGAHVWRHDD